MRNSSFVRIALALTFAAGCGPSAAQWRQISEINKKQIADETDPDAKAWMQRGNECTWGGGDSPRSDYEAMNKCHAENEQKTLASLKQQAETETRPAAKEAYARAAACIEKLPTMSGVSYRMHPDVKACLDDKRRSLSRESLIDDEDYAKAEKDGSADAWLAFVAKHREDKRVPDAVKAIVKASASANDEQKSAIEEKLAAAYPQGLSQLPADRRILLVGPKGLRVRDLAKLTKSNVAPTLVVARVKTSSEPYKNFDADELGALKTLGLADEVVAAMLEVTAKLEEKKKSDDERQALRTELAALRKMIEEKQASGAKSGGQTVQTKDGPMDVLASCAKRLGAMNLCENLPFPGSTLCKSTAESEFPCPDAVQNQASQLTK
jgi:hypothetical protein